MPFAWLDDWLPLLPPEESMPEGKLLFELKGYIQRRQGKPEEAVRSLERAVDLDPRRSDILQQIALS